MFDDNNLYGKAYGLAERGRHASLGSALDAALRDLLVERNPFYDTVTQAWPKLFPKEAAQPGRFEDGWIYLYVRNATASYAVRSRLGKVRKALAALPGAPAKINLRVEIHTT